MEIQNTQYTFSIVKILDTINTLKIGSQPQPPGKNRSHPMRELEIEATTGGITGLFHERVVTAIAGASTGDGARFFHGDSVSNKQRI